MIFANHVGNKTRNVTNVLHLPDFISVVGGNENDADETDVRE